MYKRGLWTGLAVILAVLAVALVIAASAGRGSLINKNYVGGGSLSGTINVSLNNDLASLKLNAVFSKTGYTKESLSSKTIVEILSGKSIPFTCSPLTCADDYSLSSPEEEKIVDITDESKLVAFKISGRTASFDSLSFAMNIENSETCNNPLQIDVLDDGIIDWQASNMTDDYTCSENTGCYSDYEDTDYSILTTEPYCELMKLPPSGKFQLGAWIKKGTDWSDGLLVMSLYSTDGSELETCDLSDPSGTEGLTSCEFEYNNPELQDLYVCIASTDETNYKIKTENSNPVCGISTSPSSGNVPTEDFYIFAKTPKYDSAGDITESSIDDLDDKIQGYLESVYKNNCTRDCKIPIRFISNTSATINISGISLKYTTSSLKSDEIVYDAIKNPLKISSNYSILNLEDFDVKVPNLAGSYTLKLYLGSALINQTSINVEIFEPILAIYPDVAILKLPTDFTLTLNGNVSALNYEWNFGDGTLLTTTTNKATHAYNYSGVYALKVTLTTSDGKKASITRNITTASARDSVNMTLSKYQGRLNMINTKLLGIDSWAQGAIKTRLGVSGLDTRLASMRQSYLQATSDAQYTTILNNLSTERVPSTLDISSQTELPYYMDYNLIDIAKLSTLGAGTSADKKQIAAWMNQNMNLKVQLRTISAGYDSSIDKLMLVNLKIEPKQTATAGKNFVVVEGSAVFKDASQNLSGGSGFVFNDLSAKDIMFLHEADKFTELIIYIAPEFSQLASTVNIECKIDGICDKTAGETRDNCPEDCKNYGTAVFVIILILLLGAGAAYGLLWWYKRNYETMLFKGKREDLFNLMNFIRAAKLQNMPSKDIYNKLKEQGWNAEQISYGFMQVEGSIWARLIGQRQY